jgi:hypothetical protein
MSCDSSLSVAQLFSECGQVSAAFCVSVTGLAKTKHLSVITSFTQGSKSVMDIRDRMSDCEQSADKPDSGGSI